jgi:hypothetical protein
LKTIHVFTSAACNYLPKAQVLAVSIRKFHPEWRLHLALADLPCQEPALTSGYFDEIHLFSDLEIPNYLGWAFGHTIVELSTAIKPFMLKKLLGRDDCGGVLYFDPDMVLFSPLNDITAFLTDGSAILTPHLLEPETDIAAIMDNEICSLKHGVYNMGFFGTGYNPEGLRFASWWADRVYHFCRDDIPNGLFTDQRWIDLVPAFFNNVVILKSPRFNVATWNITSRKLSGQVPDSLYLNGEPLGFYHFTGFDSGAHVIMAGKYGHDQPLLEQLIRWYQESCRKFESNPEDNPVWQLSHFQDGTAILPAMRKIYRERDDLKKAFPDPFAVSGNSFLMWWKTYAPLEYPSLFVSESTIKDQRK